MAGKDSIRLTDTFEQLLSPGLKDQLRAIGGRVYDVVGPAIDQARRAGDDAGRRDALAEGHAIAATIFESECQGYFHNVPGGLELFNSLACKSGCTFCCELKLEVTIFEAGAIWAGLQGAEHARARDAVLTVGPRTAALDTEARRRARIPCALLDADRACTIYAIRPYGCRGMFATNAADCEGVLKAPAGAPLPAVRSPAVPRALSTVFAAGANAALADKGVQHDFVELNAALAALVSDPATLGAWLDGKKAFAPVVPG